MCAIAKKGISKQMSVSEIAREMCSLSVYGPTGKRVSRDLERNVSAYRE